MAACEGGLEPPPPEPEPVGVIKGTVTYSGTWPPHEQVVDLRFVPLKSIPLTPLDIFADLENLRFSNRLLFNVEVDTFIVTELRDGLYLYNAIARQASDNIFNWSPLGLYEENDGIIIVNRDTTTITIHVDFDNLPPFPPGHLE